MEHLLHMLCQRDSTSNSAGVTVGECARWMGISKPTMQRHLDRLVKNGWLDVREKQWRPNAIVLLYRPTLETSIKYHRGDYKLEYHKFMTEKIAESPIGEQWQLL